MIEWIVERNFQTGLDNALESQKPVDGIRAYVDIFYQNQLIIERIEESDRCNYMLNRMFEQTAGFLSRMVSEKSPSVSASSRDHDAWTRFMGCGFAGYVLKSMKEHMTQQDVVYDLNRFIKGESSMPGGNFIVP